MEVFIEVILQIIIEVFGELILTAIAKFIGLFFKRIDTDSLLRKRLKFVLTYVFMGLIIVLITTSLIYSTRYLVVISLSYMLFQIIVTLLEIINKDQMGHPLMKTIKIFRKVSHYAFPLLLIIFSSMNLDNSQTLAIINTMSCIAILVWLCIDGYRIWKYKEK